MPNTLKDLTFLLPVRIDSPERLANLMTVVRFYEKQTESEFIVLEADDSPKAMAVTEIGERIRYEFIRDDDQVFHHTHLNNTLLKMARTPCAALWDADAIAPLDQIRGAMSLIKEKGHTMAYPYGGMYWNVGETFSEIFRQRLDIRMLTDFPQSRYLLCGYHSVGGAVLVDLAGYAACGDDNENIKGWGPEDAERFKRLEILGLTPARADGSLYHLHHPRGLNSGDFRTEVAMATKKEYCRICAMDKENLLEEIKKWSWKI